MAPGPTGDDLPMPDSEEPVNPRWDHDSKLNLDDIEVFKNAPDFAKKHVQLQAFEYHHLPVIHGYKLGNGDIWISYVAWLKDSSRLSGADLKYEFIPHADTTTSAVMKRKLFNSWLRASHRSIYPPNIQQQP